MAGYARLLLSEYSNPEHAYGICAEVFRVVYASIQKAGDQGLSMGEISKVINLPGAEVHGSIVDALQAFGLTLKTSLFKSVPYYTIFHSNDDIVVTFPPSSIFLHQYLLTAKVWDVSPTPLQVIQRFSQPIDIPVQNPSLTDNDIMEAMLDPSLKSSPIPNLVVVNAYDTIRVVDVVYRHKYFLISGSAFHHLVQPSSTKAIEESDHTSEIYKSDKRDTSSIHTPSERTTIDNAHRVTILNLPREDVDPENQASDRNESCKQDRLGLSRVDHEKETLKFSSCESCVPILPWINGDGTINNVVYRGLRRRVLGIVMQNPGMLEVIAIRLGPLGNSRSAWVIAIGRGLLDDSRSAWVIAIRLRPLDNSRLAWVGGTGSERFELSQQFLQSVLKSPFPFNTGKQAVKFSAWLEERGKDLTEVGANISGDLQCGDIFHLFALVSSGDISILPCLPDNGIGEAEDLRNAKRKYDVTESSYGDKVKKPKSFFGVEGEIISRREKGFPGIAVSAYRTTISKVDILNLFKDNDNNGQPFGGDLQLSISQTGDYSVSDHIFEIGKSCEPMPLKENHTESPWEAMAGYARLLLSEYSNPEHAYGICAEVFRVVYAAIQKAGDQGLSMGEISKVINLPGAEVHGSIVDALQAFGLTLKVNAYDTIRVVDVVYRHKYFLISGSAFHHLVQPSSTKAIEESDHTSEIYKSDKRDTSSIHTPSERTTIDNAHRVTILNLPREDVDPENQASDRNESCKQDRLGLSRVDHEKETLKFSSCESCVPILPWINGDGTINNVVYRGLRRRVLGIVMQNPGMLEDDILRHMHVLNPQNCRTLLEMMVLDKHLIVRKMLQNVFDGGPTLLQGLIGSTSSQPKLICREHFFANPMSTALL
ncbi:uncharacterized protein LOC124843954 [Vigna umbellata]|uniref:uncharacterized protein LOC124843954 n=1 Tax=Vigna umbellata TaxID=87088 RepID=UPI001F5FD2F9|nr:uncharacterized protein LOC124843954 [Vigna umbellata]